MKKRTKRNGEGSAILTVLIVVFSICAVLGVAVAAGMQRAFMSKRLADQVRAKAIAEAGVAQTYVCLSTNWPPGRM